MIKIVPIDGLCEELVDFFEQIKDNKFFHPHPFTRKEANARCCDSDDIYAVCAEHTESQYHPLCDKIYAYGMVRSFNYWMIPCIGIYVDENCRRKGMGETLVRFLHLSAKLKGIKRLRLHVHPENKKAIALYEKLGYEFIGTRENGELIGFKGL